MLMSTSIKKGMTATFNLSFARSHGIIIQIAAVWIEVDAKEFCDLRGNGVAYHGSRFRQISPIGVGASMRDNYFTGVVVGKSYAVVACVCLVMA